MGSHGERTCCKAVAGEPGWARQQLVDRPVPNLSAGKLGGTTGE